jgi:hypothetical protein
MRRRLYLALFEQDGVVPVAASDLTIVPENPAANKLFHVRAGMAISLDLTAMERKEIILRQDSAVINLNDHGFPAAGPTAWVAINYEEKGTNVPPSAGDVPGDTRIIENAPITVHSTDPTGTNAPNGHPFIVLGALTFATMAVDTAQRQTARIRGALLGGGGGGGPAVATIQSISVPNGQAGTTFNATITGTNLNGATAVNFSGAGVTAIIVTNPDPQTVEVAITITGVAAAGPRTFTVVTPQGTADSTGVAGAAFSVSAVTPVVVASFSPGTQATGAGTNTIQVRGTNIRNAADAIGTIVRFVDPANPSIVVATSPNVTFLVDAVSLQRVNAVIPQRAAFTPEPAAGSTLQVLVQVQFNGVVGNSTTPLTISAT